MLCRCRAPQIAALVFVGIMTLIFCLWLANQWRHSRQEQHGALALDMGAVVYNTIVAVVMVTQLACWIAYMKLQTQLSSPALSYDFYDNRESSRARFLMPFKVNNASSTVKDIGGDDAYAGNLRWPLPTNNTGLDTFAAMMHSMNVLRSLQVQQPFQLLPCCIDIGMLLDLDCNAVGLVSCFLSAPAGEEEVI